MNKKKSNKAYKKLMKAITADNYAKVVKQYEILCKLSDAKR